jgi:hypothetical protein
MLFTVAAVKKFADPDNVLQCVDDLETLHSNGVTLWGGLKQKALYNQDWLFCWCMQVRPLLRNFPTARRLVRVRTGVGSKQACAWLFCRGMRARRSPLPIYERLSIQPAPTCPAPTSPPAGFYHFACGCCVTEIVRVRVWIRAWYNQDCASRRDAPCPALTRTAPT